MSGLLSSIDLLFFLNFLHYSSLCQSLYEMGRSQPWWSNMYLLNFLCSKLSGLDIPKKFAVKFTPQGFFNTSMQHRLFRTTYLEHRIKKPFRQSWLRNKTSGFERTVHVCFVIELLWDPESSNKVRSLQWSCL